MRLTGATKVAQGDVAEFAWSALRVFRNVEHTSAAIKAAHGLPPGNEANVRKQARQIRHCLIQAEEYARAAEAVTSATRPTLQYYSMVSLATVETLFKGNGNLSLDKARDQHGHHGLNLTVPNSNGQQATSAENLIARPARFNETRKGTFHLWQGLSRPDPICGPLVELISPAQAVQHPISIIMASPDEVMVQVPDQGHSLLTCFQHIPGLALQVKNFGAPVNWARCHFDRELRQDGSQTITVNIHPAQNDILQSIYGRISCTSPENLSYEDFPSGRIYKILKNGKDGVVFAAPNGICIGDDAYIWPYSDEEISLNYFGWLYVASFILGTFARYYPDKWMRDLEEASYVATAADEFYGLAAAHGPLCTLSQLNRHCFVANH